MKALFFKKQVAKVMQGDYIKNAMNKIEKGKSRNRRSNFQYILLLKFPYLFSD